MISDEQLLFFFSGPCPFQTEDFGRKCVILRYISYLKIIFKTRRGLKGIRKNEKKRKLLPNNRNTWGDVHGERRIKENQMRKAPIMNAQAPTISAKSPNMSAKTPTMSDKAPTMSDKAPTIRAKAPTMSAKAPTMSAKAQTKTRP